MKGRKPVPSHLRLVRGNPGKRAINKREPKPRRERPSAPKHISDRAREAWGLVVALLDRMGILTEADTVAVEMLCEAYGDYLQARADLEAFGGRYYETRTGQGAAMHRAHPALAAMQDADRRIRGWLAEFGMTPSARSRVKADGIQETADPAERYFA